MYLILGTGSDAGATHHQLWTLACLVLILVLTLCWRTIEYIIDILIVFLEVLFQFLHSLTLILLLVLQPLNFQFHLFFFNFFTFVNLGLVLVRYENFNVCRPLELLYLLLRFFARLTALIHVIILLNAAPTGSSVFLSFLSKWV